MLVEARVQVLSRRLPACSIKREIGHLCHDERRSSTKDKTPTASSAIQNPPVEVARALPGKLLLFQAIAMSA